MWCGSVKHEGVEVVDRQEAADGDGGKGEDDVVEELCEQPAGGGDKEEADVVTRPVDAGEE